VLAGGAEGEVQVRGPGVMQGYHDDPAGTAEALTGDGWLRTGDLGRMGDDGYLRITGRLKDIIIRGGENIAPAEIESLLRGHPDVADAAVVGVPHEHFGEEVAAGILLKRGHALDAAALAGSLHGHLASFKIPTLWKAFEAFPLTGSGKVKKFELRQRFGTGAVRTGG
jgi:acyl-CoA synthetase (AMP-forming)/AMP-acid ligase II